MGMSQDTFGVTKTRHPGVACNEEGVAMKSYVLGFLFSESLQYVALIRKNRPEWQQGKLNGIGGHIELGEDPHTAMGREFGEEAAHPVTDWTCFGRLRGEGWMVFLFHSIWHESTPMPSNSSDEGEVNPYFIPNLRTTLPNLRYLIPMALNHISAEDKCLFFDIYESQWNLSKSKPDTDLDHD